MTRLSSSSTPSSLPSSPPPAPPPTPPAHTVKDDAECQHLHSSLANNAKAHIVSLTFPSMNSFSLISSFLPFIAFTHTFPPCFPYNPLVFLIPSTANTTLSKYGTSTPSSLARSQGLINIYSVSIGKPARRSKTVLDM
jgi:hypothetical protein